MKITRRLLRNVLTFPLLIMPIAAYCIPIYTMHFFHADDQMDGFITNSAHNQTLFLTCNFGADCGVFDFTSFVTPGINTLTVQDFNGPTVGPLGPISGSAGYTYGFDFQIDGVTYDSASCGTFNTYGCNNDSYQTGLVYSHTIQFNGPSPVPSPGTFSLTAIGLLAFASIRRKELLNGWRDFKTKIGYGCAVRKNGA